MPDDRGAPSSTERAVRSRTRRVMAAIFVVALLGLAALTLELPKIATAKAAPLALLWTALAMFALALIVGGIFIWFVATRFKDTGNEFRRVQGIVQSATGARTQWSEGLSHSAQVRVVALLLALPVLALLLYFVVHRLFPNAPSWTPVAVIWIAGIILALLPYRKVTGAPESSVRRPPLWRTLLNLSLWFALFLLVTNFDPKRLSPYISPKTLLILLTGLCLALPFIVWGLGFLRYWWIGHALARADYETALGRAASLLRIAPKSAELHFLRGTALLFAGRYSEAEQGLLESAEAGDTAVMRSQSVTLANLGEALMLQGRYDDAIRNFEAAAQIHAGWGRPYSGIAEAYLWRDIEPERALEYVDRALERKLRSLVSRRLDRHVLAQMYADRAWALALLGRTEECRIDLAKAFRAAGRRFRPGVASVHYRAGRASLALRDVRQAIEHFRRAQELDPGSNGIQAGQMLARL